MSQLKKHTHNGYMLSIVNHGYGAEAGLFEVAVFDMDGEWVTRPPFEHAVVGWQTKEEVEALVELVESWEPSRRKVMP